VPAIVLAGSLLAPAAADGVANLTAALQGVVGVRLLRDGTAEHCGHPAEHAGERGTTRADGPGKGVEPELVHGRLLACCRSFLPA
jgi:hypothetical protein